MTRHPIGFVSSGWLGGIRRAVGFVLSLRGTGVGRRVGFVLLLALVSTSRVQPADATATDPPPSAVAAPWPVMDGLGRSLPVEGAEGVPGPRRDRFVGVFYFLWHNNPTFRRPEGLGPFSVADILARDPLALQKPTSPPWGPMGVPHYWGEPLLGYYQSGDRWVLHRHAQLLALAGVDVLIFDATNAETYPKVYEALATVFEEIRRAGSPTPQIAFMLNTEARRTARQLYQDLYQAGRFRDLWFLWEGKPLLICDPAEADPEIRAFFTLRRAHWPFTMKNTKNAWHWEATFPQPYGYTTDPKRAEQVVVSVAQNLRDSDGKVVNMSSGHARGRSFHDGARDTSPGAVDRGGNLAEQWRRALELDPPFVLVTGWNEWYAGRFERPGEPVAFVDQFDREYSRDIEPMRGGHGDAYYYQMVDSIRRYKGVAPLPSALAPVASVTDAVPAGIPVYTDAPDDTAPRDHIGSGGLHYTNRSGRNDIVKAQVSHDAQSVAFLVQTKAPLTPATDPNWMMLLIDADQNPATGWEGYDYLVNRTAPTATTAHLSRHAGPGWTWVDAAEIPYTLKGERLTITIPRVELRLPAGTTRTRLDFKWLDNSQSPGDILDTYQSGDAAPEGRFRFRFEGN